MSLLTYHLHVSLLWDNTFVHFCDYEFVLTN
jgi:hypothetical protein